MSAEPTRTASRAVVRFLGPVELRVDGQQVELRGYRERAIVAALGLRFGEVVSTSQLADVIWGPTAPPTASVQIQACVGAIRKRLAAAGIGDPREVLVTRSPGYTLPAATADTDLAMFRQHAHDAVAAMQRGDHPHARTRYQHALDLWRGTPFQDVAAAEFDTAAERLGEERLAAVEGRVDCDLHAGRAVDLVAELTELVDAHPLRERLRGQLMLALYLAGRQADALEVYAQGRRQLVEELGLDPGEQLQQLHRDILAGQVSGFGGDTARAEFQAGLPVPRQLPPAIGTFVGRAADVQAAAAALAGPGDTAPVVVCLHGGGGVGKTTFAVHLAHLARESFPDGQLYAHLGGTTGPAAEPLEVLAGFLHAFGIDDATMPSGAEERVALFRSCIADRNVLIVLDDAASSAQVRALLPTTAGSAAIVTSRQRLVDLDGTRQVPLDMLADAEALDLLRNHVGREHVDREPAAAAQLVELCGGLPLALRVAAARLARTGTPALERFARRLADERQRLDLLQTGDLAVRANLLLSWETLSTDQRTLLQRLTLLPPGQFPEWVAAALLDVDEHTGADLLDELAAAHLVEPACQDTIGYARYQLHDLVRLVAAEQLEAEADTEANHAAFTRVLETWLGLAEAADKHIPSQRAYVVALPPSGRLPELGRLVGDDAQSWFDDWYPQLASTVTLATELAPDSAALLAIRMFGSLTTRRRHDVVLRTLTAVADADGVSAELRARILLQLCTAYGLADTPPADVLPFVHMAVQAAEASGNPYLIAKSRERLASGLWESAELDSALAEVDALLPVAPELEHRLYRQLLRLRGLILADAGRLDEGIEEASKAVALHTDDTAALVLDMHQYARMLLEAERPAEGQRHIQKALGIINPDSRSLPHLHMQLAHALTLLGDPTGADEAMAEATAQLHASGGRVALDQVTMDITRGTIQSLRGHHTTAVATLGRALAELERFREPRIANKTRKALADAYRRAGDHARARTYQRQLPFDTDPHATAADG